jgi:hypothetical protein
MTHQHTSNGREWLMVEVPSEATALQTIVGNLTIQTAIQVGNVVPYKLDTWQIHSDSLTITEEQAGEIVERGHEGIGYMDYDPTQTDIVEWMPVTYFDGAPFVEATDSYRSLLRSLQINSRVINLVRI